MPQWHGAPRTATRSPRAQAPSDHEPRTTKDCTRRGAPRARPHDQPACASSRHGSDDVRLPRTRRRTAGERLNASGPAPVATQLASGQSLRIASQARGRIDRTSLAGVRLRSGGRLRSERVGSSAPPLSQSTSTSTCPSRAAMASPAQGALCSNKPRHAKSARHRNALRRAGGGGGNARSVERRGCAPGTRVSERMGAG